MIIGFVATVFIGFVVGIIWERYKWVRIAKNGKFAEVDGELYTASKVNVKRK